MAGLPSSLGLLADYASSSDEGASDGGETRAGDDPISGALKSHSPGTTVNYFEGRDSSSSDEESGSNTVDMTCSVDTAPAVPVCSVEYHLETRLPAPKLGPVADSHQTHGQSGVFANPFREEQKAQLTLLEKHVQLTLQEKPMEIGGRKICLAYRKDGRCRFGRSCKFAHDSDLLVTSNAEIPRIHSEDASVVTCTQEWAGEEGGVVFDNVQPQQGKRKSGLSQTLIPPKRTLKHYKAQLGKERPWVL
ncbi:uncharacterized protein [Pleurodeles waltl]|uniref:uncharacterized protein n=1 Tax=Pleurodeles waltl TaxID=8319 RepID=UPI003709710B